MIWERYKKWFSQRSGIEQSMMSTMISSIIGHLTQQGSQNSLKGGNLGGGGGIQSALSNIGPLSPNHALVQRVQQDTGIQEPQRATRYTQQAVDFINEHSNSNPQGIDVCH
jgi:inosine-uridine nucleoside N-ribohydrolase